MTIEQAYDALKSKLRPDTKFSVRAEIVSYRVDAPINEYQVSIELPGACSCKAKGWLFFHGENMTTQVSRAVDAETMAYQGKNHNQECNALGGA